VREQRFISPALGKWSGLFLFLIAANLFSPCGSAICWTRLDAGRLSKGGQWCGECPRRQASYDADLRHTGAPVVGWNSCRCGSIGAARKCRDRPVSLRLAYWRARI